MGSRVQEMTPSSTTARTSMATATGRRVEVPGMDMGQFPSLGSSIPASRATMPTSS